MLTTSSLKNAKSNKDMFDKTDQLKEALRDQQRAIELEQANYRTLTLRWAEYQAGRAIKPPAELFQDWKASMQRRVEIAMMCVGLSRP